MRYLIITLLGLVYRVVDLAVWAYVILSWFANASPKLYKIYCLLAKYLEPVLRPIRKLLAPITYRIGLDFSAYALILALGAVYRLLVNILYIF